MRTLLVFTENYWPGVAGESYLVELVNGARGVFDDAVIAFNPEALDESDLRRLSEPAETRHVRIITGARIWNLLHGRRPVLTALLVRLAQALDPFVLEYDIALLRRLIRQVRPDVVLGYNGGYPAARSVLAMTIAAEREGVPVALSVVSMPAVRRPRLRCYEAWLDRRVGAATQAIIVNAQQIASALAQERQLPPEKMRVIHNALPDTGVARHTADGARIGCVARMDSGKGIPDLLESFAAVLARHPGAQLILAGDGPELPRFRRMAEGLGCAAAVHFTGYYDGDIAALTATFDVYAYPSHWEGLPYAILEAMRAGCAIVATDVGGIGEAIIDDETGLLVAPQAPGQLTDALDRLLGDTALRQRLGHAARAQFEKEFHLPVMHERVGRAFSELLEGLPAPPR